jgi:hypothetical protein
MTYYILYDILHITWRITHYILHDVLHIKWRRYYTLHGILHITHYMAYYILHDVLHITARNLPLRMLICCFEVIPHSLDPLLASYYFLWEPEKTVHTIILISSISTGISMNILPPFTSISHKNTCIYRKCINLYDVFLGKI